MFGWLKALWPATPPAEPVVIPVPRFTRRHAPDCEATLDFMGQCSSDCENDAQFRERIAATRDAESLFEEVRKSFEGNG